ncbi:MAG: hypothetical protein RL217_1608 [Pseudomonadota bacterium]|jgi:negative regulator of flagellin synthesis FlgM
MNITKLITGLDSGSRTRTEPSSSSGSKESKAAGGTSLADQVRLSASSKSIQQVEAEVRNMPEVDDAAVERIRSAIERGEYKVDYEKLAGKMLNFEGDLN